jgi:hypothetical protein
VLVLYIQEVHHDRVEVDHVQHGVLAANASMTTHGSTCAAKGNVWFPIIRVVIYHQVTILPTWLNVLDFYLDHCTGWSC